MRVMGQFDAVICPPSTDTHQDHQTVHQEAVRVFRNAPLLLGWDSPQNERTATRDVFIELDEGHLGRKLKAFACYRSQRARIHTGPDMWRSLARVRGLRCRAETGLAEAFELLNMRIAL